MGLLRFHDVVVIRATRFCLLFLLFCLGVELDAETFKNPRFVATGTDPQTLVQGDFNRDGNPDLAYIDGVLPGLSVHVLLGNGDGTFQRGQDIALPPNIGASITVADVNNDGELDLIFGSIGPQAMVAVLLGKGDGTFGPIILSQLPLSPNLYPNLQGKFGVADFDGDGIVDLIVSDVQNSQIYVLHGDNTGSFTLKTIVLNNSHPSDIFVGDFNGDDRKDFVAHGTLGADATVYLGNGDGTFQPGVRYTGPDNISSLLLADMDGDGRLDMVVSGFSGGIEILHGNPDGTFAATSSGGTSNGGPLVAVLDFNRDGILDIGTAGNGPGITILLGQGNLSYGPAKPCGISGGASAIAVADFNHDGYPDFAVAVPDGIALLLANPDGTLQSFDVYLPGNNVSSVAVADFNRDRVPDIAVAAGTELAILLGRGDGTFNPNPLVTNISTSNARVTTGDFNGDGSLDVLLSGTNIAGPVLFGNGDGTFAAPVEISGLQVIGFSSSVIGDFNGDGKSDIAITNYESIDVVLGHANNTFTLLSSQLTLLQPNVIPAVGDFNKDGKLDLVVAGVTTLQVFNGDGDGTFSFGRTLQTEIPGYTNLNSPQAIAVADLDGDGNLDIIVPISYPSVAEIFYGNGDGSFQDPVLLQLARGYTQMAVADVNGDGRPDLLFSDGGLISIVHNTGNRTFAPEVHYVSGGVSSFVVQDVNGDGFPDIVIAGTGGNVAVLLNRPGGNLVTGTLSVQPEPSALSQPFNVSLTISPLSSGQDPPTGSVSFAVDGDIAATVPLTVAGASLTISSPLALGSHTISAAYSGDANFLPADFSVLHQIVPVLHPTTIALTAAPNPVLTSQTISFTATVSANGQTPFGTVGFYDGTTTLGIGTLNSNGVAVFDTALLQFGTHRVAASYFGNADFAPSTAVPVSVVVNTLTTSTALTAAPLPSQVASPISLIATVTSGSGTPFGAAVFYDGSVPLAVIPVDGTGVAVYTAFFATTGIHSLSASYQANGPFGSSTSPTLPVSVTTSSTNETSTVIASARDAQASGGLILTATVAASRGSPHGMVEFIDGTRQMGVAAIGWGGRATLHSDRLLPGIHYITASYAGDESFSPSMSPALVEVAPVTQADFSIAVTPGPKVVLTGAQTSIQVMAQSVSGFRGQISLGCSTSSPYVTCSLKPGSIGENGMSTLLIARQPNQQAAFFLIGRRFRWLGFALVGLVWSGSSGRTRRQWLLLLISLAIALTFGCGVQQSDCTGFTGNHVVTVRADSTEHGTPITHSAQVMIEIR